MRPGLAPLRFPRLCAYSLNQHDGNRDSDPFAFIGEIRPPHITRPIRLCNRVVSDSLLVSYRTKGRFPYSLFSIPYSFT